jgi:ubiquinone/menaquinone biosynthesis C-methylase UbiE
MLRRARAEADRCGIHWIEFAEADVEALPFEDRSFDLALTYTGLHCFPDPSAATAKRWPACRARAASCAAHQ